MVNGIRANEPQVLNKGSWDLKATPEEGWRTYLPKRCEYNNKVEDNSPKTLND